MLLISQMLSRLANNSGSERTLMKNFGAQRQIMKHDTRK